MNKAIQLSLLIPGLLLSPATKLYSAPQVITTEDGREVLLMDDGTWAYRSTDRFATTNDGRRVRLKQDGSWQYTQNARLVTREQVRTRELDIKLQKVVIETYKKKIKKVTRIKSQTLFYLNLDLSPVAKSPVIIKKTDIARVSIKDSSGTIYPVLSIQPATETVKPGASTTIIIRAEGSPSVLSKAKSMQVVMRPGIFGQSDTITLSEKIAEFEEKNVERLKRN